MGWFMGAFQVLTVRNTRIDALWRGAKIHSIVKFRILDDAI